MSEAPPEPYAPADVSYDVNRAQGQRGQPTQGYPPQKYPPYGQQSQGYPLQGYPPPPTQPVQEAHVATDVPAEPSPDYREDEVMGSSFSEKSIRLAFVKKVFGILAIQILLTAGIMCIFMFVEEVRVYCQENSWLYITSICVYFVLVIALGCFGDLRRRFPLNLIILFCITLSMAVMLGTISSYFEVEEVLIAIGIVCLVTIAMTIMGLQQKFDVTYLTGTLVMLTMCLCGFAICAAIFQTSYGYLFLATLGAFLFSMWILVDIQLMMGGKHKLSIDPEEYIMGALNIYLDIVNLLLFVLIIVKACKG